MNLSEIRKAYEELSGKLSDINRQLCFAGFAIIWIFNQSDKGVSIPKDLYEPAALFSLSLLMDILLYAIPSIIWYIYYWCKRKKGTDESIQEVYEPEYLNIFGWIFWFTKIVFLIWGYSSLAFYLLKNS